MSYGNCPGKNKTVASFTTNSNDPERRTWDLIPFKAPGMGPPGGTWRIIELGGRITYYAGKISEDGRFVSSAYVPPAAEAVRSAKESEEDAFPDSFTTGYDYDGFMEIQVTDPECDEETGQ